MRFTSNPYREIESYQESDESRQELLLGCYLRNKTFKEKSLQ
jgi:hypothetical protein